MPTGARVFLHQLGNFAAALLRRALIGGVRYNSGMWIRSSWRGVTAHKLPEDMWNYQEIISDMSPSIILEVCLCPPPTIPPPLLLTPHAMLPPHLISVWRALWRLRPLLL